VVFRVTGEDASGALSTIEHRIEPGGLVPPQVHHLEDELSYLIEGQIGVRIRDEELEVAASSYVFKPRGVPYTSWKTGPEPARILEIICPAGFEKFFEDISTTPAPFPADLMSRNGMSTSRTGSRPRIPL
jgi:mannose-6-phosphate isomerase-like protein (cupin superfamily)